MGDAASVRELAIFSHFGEGIVVKTGFDKLKVVWQEHFRWLLIVLIPKRQEHR
jgi:hypothetical protein